MFKCQIRVNIDWRKDMNMRILIAVLVTGVFVGSWHGAQRFVQAESSDVPAAATVHVSEFASECEEGTPTAKQAAALGKLDAEIAELEATLIASKAKSDLQKKEVSRIKELVTKKAATRESLLRALKALDFATIQVVDAKIKLAQVQQKKAVLQQTIKSGKAPTVPKSPDGSATPKPTVKPVVKNDGKPGVKLLAKPDVPVVVKPANGTDEKKPDKDKPEAGKTDLVKAVPVNVKPPVDPRLVKLMMSDGTSVAGRLSISTLKVRTRFGVLSIPIENLRSFKPGLNSRPAYKEKIEGLIQKLGDAVEPARRAAATELIKMGPNLLPVIEKYRLDEDTTRRSEIIKLIEKLHESQDDDGFENRNVIRFLDQVSTTAFTLAGEVLDKTFELESDFGKLTMSIGDIVEAKRASGVAEEFTRNVSVTDQNFPARGYKTSGFRVEKGDVVEIRASGRLSMLRWGSSAFSGPDGASNYGWYVSNKIANGALIYKIGSSGTAVKTGTKTKFTVKKSGLLYFGIGMTERYTRSSYRYPGTYKVKLRVTRK
jgi:hypothetical protein